MYDGTNELIISREKVKYSLWINCFKTLHCSSGYSFTGAFIQTDVDRL